MSPQQSILEVPQGSGAKVGPSRGLDSSSLSARSVCILLSWAERNRKWPIVLRNVSVALGIKKENPHAVTCKAWPGAVQGASRRDAGR